MKLELPHNFKCRDYQKNLWNSLKEKKRAFCLYHRRAGKDITLWNKIITEAIKKTGIYYYFLPTYTQGKKIIWDGIDNNGMKFVDYIPEVLIKSKNGQEMKIELINGSIIQIIGTDNYDAIRGTNPIGCVFSEYAFQNPQAWEVVKPILKVNGGWAIFNTTPNGKNHAYDLWNMATESPDWFTEKLTINDTGLLTEKDMEEERREGMTEEMIQQEYYVSFDVGALGAYYSDQLKEAQDRIVNLPIEPNIKVETWWDLGRNDSTAIIFTQAIGKEIRIIDSYEMAGKDITHFIKILDDKNYRWGIHNLPHDGSMKRIETKLSVQEQLEQAGYKTRIIPRIKNINDGIQRVRALFHRFYFDSEKTKQFIRALENYHREWDSTNKVFMNQPKHSWASHYADALRTLAQGWNDYDDDDLSYEEQTENPDYFNDLA